MPQCTYSSTTHNLCSAPFSHAHSLTCTIINNAKWDWSLCLIIISAVKPCHRFPSSYILVPAASSVSISACDSVFPSSYNSSSLSNFLTSFHTPPPPPPTTTLLYFLSFLLSPKFSFVPLSLIFLCTFMTWPLAPSLYLAHFLLLSLLARSQRDQREDKMERGKANPHAYIFCIFLFFPTRAVKSKPVLL